MFRRCKLGIVDYLSRFPTFEAPLPSSFDEKYVVKFVRKLFDECNFLDSWAKNSSYAVQQSDFTSISHEMNPFVQNHKPVTSINYISSIRQLSC